MAPFFWLAYNIYPLENPILIVETLLGLMDSEMSVPATRKVAASSRGGDVEAMGHHEHQTSGPGNGVYGFLGL